MNSRRRVNSTVGFLLLCATEKHMARVIEVNSRSAADVLVYEVNSRSAADLLVCVVNSRSAAVGDALWCYVNSRSAASSKIYWVNSRSAADLLVCFINSRSAARWQRSHPLHGKL